MLTNSLTVRVSRNEIAYLQTSPEAFYRAGE